MLYKLDKNSSKGRWSSGSVPSHFLKLADEVQELKEAIAEGNMVNILLESADVANFALIIASEVLDHGE